MRAISLSIHFLPYFFVYKSLCYSVLVHTNLTDILRQYLDNQYDIDAAEMTSDQITEACSEKQDISAEQNDNLRQILQTADLVKFAKAEPQPWEHDRSMSQSVDFVSQTAAATKQRLLLMQQKQNDKTE